MNARETGPSAAFRRSPFAVPMAVAGAWGAYTTSLMDRMAGIHDPAEAARIAMDDAAARRQVLKEAVRPSRMLPYPDVEPVASWPSGDLLWAGGPEGAGADEVPELIVPPQGTRLDAVTRMSADGSPMIVGPDGEVRDAYVIRWAVEPPEDATIDEPLALIADAIAELGGRVRLTGWSQGGWMSFIHAALHPETVARLTLAGTPVDFHAGGPWPSTTKIIAQMSYLPWVRPVADMMVTPVGAVLRTALVNDVWRLYDPVGEAGRVAAAMLDPDEGLRDVTTFTATAPMTPPQYNWFLQHLLRGNELARGVLEIGGEVIDASRITCPVHLIVGAEDGVVEPGQGLATEQVLADAGSPAEVTSEVFPVGHMSLFGAGALPGDGAVEVGKLFEGELGEADGEGDGAAVSPSS